jgi:hypothetical protein
MWQDNLTDNGISILCLARLCQAVKLIKLCLCQGELKTPMQVLLAEGVVFL